MTAIRCTILAIFVILAFAAPAGARTWRVERDGGGDYKVIQHAVDAAASGDTIRIGVGRFDEMQLVTCPGWSDSVMVMVVQHELTIIGSGPETIIGKEEIWEQSPDERKGIAAGDYWGNHILRVKNLHIENMRTGIYTSYESAGHDTVTVSNCSFYANRSALSLIGDGGLVDVSNCTFDHMARDGRHIVAWRQSDLRITDCNFTLWDYHVWSQKHIGLNSVEQVRILNCIFLEGASGISIDRGGPVSIENCLFDGQRNVALSPSIMSNVTVEACTFRNQTSVAGSSQSTNSVTISHCVIESVSDYTFYMAHTGSFSVNNCDLSGGERGIVWCAESSSCFDIKTLDFTGNYWGTDDPDSIQALIRDRNDGDDACFYIDFEPFRSESTPAESTSLSDIKALFRSP